MGAFVVDFQVPHNYRENVLGSIFLPLHIGTAKVVISFSKTQLFRKDYIIDFVAWSGMNQ